MRTFVLAGAMLAAMASSIASSDAATTRRTVQSYGAATTTRVAPPNGITVYGPHGFVGTDPDAFIRGQLQRDPDLGGVGRP